MTWKLCESLLVAIIFSYVDYCGAIIGGSHIGQERFFVSIEGGSFSVFLVSIRKFFLKC